MYIVYFNIRIGFFKIFSYEGTVTRFLPLAGAYALGDGTAEVDNVDFVLSGKGI